MVAAVSNLRVNISGLSSFRPLAISRLGYNVATTTLGHGFVNVDPPTFPQVTIMLGSDAPIAGLRQLWDDIVSGGGSPLTVTVSLQAIDPVKGTTIDVVNFLLTGVLITQFSDGSLAPASLGLQPSNIQIARVSSTASVYATIDLPVSSSPTFKLTGSSDVMGVYAIAGGSTQVSVTQSVNPDGEIVYAPAGIAISDLSLTAVATVQSGLKTVTDPDNFTSLEQWLNEIAANQAHARDVQLTTVVSGKPTAVTTYGNSVPVRVSMINPLLVSAGGIVPYVYTMSLRPESMQVQ
jgi:hypothetical protein